MADISKIKPNGASGDEYEIKDTTARTGVLNLNAVTQSSKNVASTEVISVTDAAPINAEDVTVAIEPVQDLHGYDKPWVGGAGKNLLHFYRNGESEITISASGTTTGGAYSLLTGELPSGTYTYKNYSGNICYVMFSASDYSHSVAVGQSYTFEYDGSSFLRIQYSNITSTTTFKGQIESGSTATSYAPYTNICPISGWDSVNVVRAGKNLLSLTNATCLYREGEFNITSNNSFTISRLAFGRTNIVNVVIKVNHNTDYSFDFVGTDGVSKSCLTFTEEIPTSWMNAPNISKSGNSGLNNYAVICFEIESGSTSIVETVSNIQLELGSTPTAYEPYQGNTYTVSLSSAGTVYSGTLDVTTGSLVVTHKYVDLSDITFTVSSVYKQAYISDVKAPSSDYEAVDAICEQYNIVARMNTDNKGDAAVDTQKYLKIRTDDTPDGGFCYELATPQTYTLTPTQIKMLLNNNTLYADCGDISLKYQPNNVIGELKGEIEDVAGKVTQPITNTDESRPLLFAESNSGTPDTARKSENIKVDPYKDVADDRYATLTLGNNLAEGATGKAGGRLDLHNPWSTGKVTLEGYAEDGEELNFKLPSEDPTENGVPYFTTLASLAHIGLVKQYRVPESMHTISVTSGAIGSYITTIEINCYWAQHPVIHAAITSLKNPEKYIAVVTCPYQYNKLYVHLYRATTDAFVIDEEDIRIISIHYYDPLAP